MALLCEVTVLAAPDFNQSFKLEVDASAGAVLLQDDAKEIDRPVKEVQ